MTYIIDAHQDIAYNAIAFNRDIRRSAFDIRKSESGTQIPIWNNGETTVGWPEYQEGQIAVIIASLFIPPWQYRGGDWDVQAYQNPQQARKLYHNQIDYYRRLVDESPEMFKLILNKRDLASVISQYENPVPGEKRQVGLVISMEGAEGLSNAEELEDYHSLGLRLVGPVWAGNRYCGGSKEDRPFDNEARKLLEVMESLRMALDISHMRENSALAALDLYEGTVIASHANSRKFLNSSSERHLTDQVIHKLHERNGTVGVVPYCKFLNENWTPASAPDYVKINQLVAQIDYYCQLSGNSLHTGIGSDLDGGFGYLQIPLELNTINDLQKIKPALLEKGYTQEDVANIFGLNWKRHLENTLPE